MTYLHKEVEFIVDNLSLTGWVVEQVDGLLRVKINAGPECGSIYEISPEDILEDWDLQDTYEKFTYSWSEE